MGNPSCNQIGGAASNGLDYAEIVNQDLSELVETGRDAHAGGRFRATAARGCIQSAAAALQFRRLLHWQDRRDTGDARFLWKAQYHGRCRGHPDSESQ